MDWQTIDRQNDWNNALARLPNAHILQTWQWGEFKSHYGWMPTRVLLVENGESLAASQILKRTLPKLGINILYAPRGPAVDYSDPAKFNRALAFLERFAAQQKAIFIKIDPALECDSSSTNVLREREWHISSDQIQYRNTLSLDLQKSEDELLAAMKPKWRYNIRLAQKRGVRVESGNRDHLGGFYRLYAETSARDGFLIRQFDYYREIWTALLETGLAHLMLAWAGEEMIAGLMLFTFARRAWYFYGASGSIHRDKMPNHLLQWEAIRWAQRNGCIEYDFWGAPERLDESDPMFGVYRFKEGFGARFVRTVGAHDFIVNPLFYLFYTRFYPWYIGQIRKRHSLVSLPAD